MSAIEWDERGQHWYENGVDHVVLYPASNSANVYGKGVAWNGVSTIDESPEGGELSAVYADNIKYLNLRSAEEFKATIEAYNYPVEFNACNGRKVMKGAIFSGQPRKKFCLCYRTWVGNEYDPKSWYKLHIIYNALAAPSEEGYETINDSPEAMSMSWELSTTPVNVPGFKPTAHLVLDSRKIDSGTMGLIKTLLYGSDSQDPRILMPDEIVSIIEGGAPLYRLGIDKSGGSIYLYLDNFMLSGQDLRIEWGDGEITLVTYADEYTHTYASGNTDYEAKIYGVGSLKVTDGADYIKSVSISGYGTVLPDNSFRYCTNLTSVTIGNGVTSIGYSAFQNCTSLASINIPNGVTSINGAAFNGCSALMSVTIGNGVRSIDDTVFQGCSALTSINIGNSVASIGMYAFYNCTSLASINIPDSVTSIGMYAFNGCSALTSATIGTGVGNIGNSAFRNCTSLSSVTFSAGRTAVATLSTSDAFSGNASGRKFYVQADLLDAWKAATNWSTYASAIEALP